MTLLAIASLLGVLVGFTSFPKRSRRASPVGDESVGNGRTVFLV